ncbi:purine nucleoside permease [Aureobasidium subglaciale]|nr:purine nucleoside permease [Aureobasidium subglaciale]
MKLISLWVSSLLVANASTLSFARTPFKPKNRSASTAPARRSALIKRDASSLCSSVAPIKPKMLIISIYEDTSLNLYTNNLTIPKFSPLFPDAHYTTSGESSGCFDLTSTYFIIAGISSGNPHLVTTGSVTFARYYPQNAYYPNKANPEDYPSSLYGTEVFEVNENLLDRAYYLASLAALNDTNAAAKYRAKYGYLPASGPPSVVKCDSATSNQYWSGSVLAEAYSNYTSLLTNGSGVYCDNATLESLLRSAILGKLDFGRIIIIRTISDFDRALPGETEVYHLLYAEQGGFIPSIQNIYIAGIEIVKDVLMYCNGIYDTGLKPGNYIGDVFNSLPGPISPDIGDEANYIN